MCGFCCRVNIHSCLKHLAGNDGWCIHFDSLGRCDIYDTRPDICVTKASEKWQEDLEEAKAPFVEELKELHQLLQDACDRILEQDDVIKMQMEKIRILEHMRAN